MPQKLNSMELKFSLDWNISTVLVFFLGTVYRTRLSKVDFSSDLNTENILIGDNGHIKLQGFGVSKEGLACSDRTQTFCGVPEYVSYSEFPMNRQFSS